MLWLHAASSCNHQLFFKTQFLCQTHMYPENPEGTQVIVGSMNMGYDIYLMYVQEGEQRKLLGLECGQLGESLMS